MPPRWRVKLISKILCHDFIVTFVTFGFGMQHFQTGGLGEMVLKTGHHDHRISPPFTSFYRGYVKDRVFSTPVPDITNLEGKSNRSFCCNNWTRVGEHVERNWLSIRRSKCNKRGTCWSVLMCCKKRNFLSDILQQKE